MKIHGFQKLTLLDFPEHTACTVFTAGCNFLCPFCHNASLVTHIEGESMGQEEILSYLNKRKGLLDGVCITGGEPLLQSDIADFLAKVKAMGYAVKLDTNGSFPERLSALIEQGLVDYVAMDIKNTPEKYAETCGRAVDMEQVRRSVALLKEGRVSYEFRTTLVKELHSLSDIEQMAKGLAGARVWFLQSFVDSGDVIGKGLHAPDAEWLQKALALARQHFAETFPRGWK